MDISVIWIAAVIVFVVLELATYQLVSVWFAIGAVGGLIAHLAGGDFTIQMIVFLALTVLTLCCLRPLSMKRLKPKGLKTNTESLIGDDVLIIETVDNIKAQGRGTVRGMTWTVRSIDGSVIPENTKAKVEKIEGVKLIVKAEGE